MSSLPRSDAPLAVTDLIESVAPAPMHVGSVIRFRKVFASNTGFVVGHLRDGRAEIVTEDGETAGVPLAKIKETVAERGRDVHSSIGHLTRYLTGDVRNRSDAQVRVVQARIDELTGVRDEAIALLLDRKALSLSLPDCLALPIEPWRVRYEFLVSGAQSGDAEELASAIVADGAAPAAVRAMVALKFSRPLAEAGPDVAALFGGEPRAGGHAFLAESAIRLSEGFGALGIAGHAELRSAANAPPDLASSSRTAAILAALGRRDPGAESVVVDTATPASILDDLLDGGVRIEAATDQSGTPVDRSLHAYIVARTEPEQLTSPEVVSLGFGDEALRRYWAGDVTVEAALPIGAAQDAKAYRAAVQAGDNGDKSSSIGDPLLRELCDVIVSKGTDSPSEALLSDQSVWRELIGAGVLGSSRTGPLGELFAGVSALTRAATALYEWHWDDARSIALDGLREARAEALRDELLNIVACALWLSGQPEPALAALDNALEGGYTDALLINASVVATELEHDSAIDRFVKLAKEAPNAHQRAVAAERALVLWDNDDARIWEGDDDESLPYEIRDALRPLIREQLAEDRYLRLLRVLANRDDAWLAAQRDDAFGANAGTAVARVFRARAAGLDKYVAALGAELGKAGAADWLRQERDGLAEASIQVLLQNIEELPAAFFGLTLLESKLPLTVMQSVPLKCLTVASVAANVTRDEGEPNLKFIDLVAEAKRDLGGLAVEDRARFSDLVDMAGDALGRSYFLTRAKQMREADVAVRMLLVRIIGMPAYQINWQAVRQASAPLSEFCKDTYDVLNRVRPLVDDEDVRSAVTEVMSQARDLGNTIARTVK